jgi:primosomal protein N' (replication factor Y)
VAQPGDDLVCARCGTTRPPVCAQCGSTQFRAVRPGVHAARDAVAALVPRVAVAEVDATTTEVADAPVLVGTEAVLHRITRNDVLPPRLVAFLAFDEELFATRFRAHEQALWLLARAGRLLGPRGAGGVALLQTRVPDHAVIRAATTGGVEEFAREETATRRLLELPPFGGLAELAGAPEAVALATAAVRDADVTVIGGRDGPALVRASSPEVLADVLARTDFGPARARGRLRVEVDPPRV